MSETIAEKPLDEIQAMLDELEGLAREAFGGQAAKAASEITDAVRSSLLRALDEAQERAERAEAALREEVGRLRERVVELQAKLSRCNWYWPEDDTSSDACHDSPEAVIEDYPNDGKVHTVLRGGTVEVIYCAKLLPADDADSDDLFWAEGATKEAVEQQIFDEQVRRASAALNQEPTHE